MVFQSPSKKFLRGVRKLMADVWRNSRSAPPNLLWNSPTVIKVLPEITNINLKNSFATHIYFVLFSRNTLCFRAEEWASIMTTIMEVYSWVFMGFHRFLSLNMLILYVLFNQSPFQTYNNLVCTIYSKALNGTWQHFLYIIIKMPAGERWIS